MNRDKFDKSDSAEQDELPEELETLMEELDDIALEVQNEVNQEFEQLKQESAQNPTNPSLILEDYRDCFGEPREMMRRHLLCVLCGAHLTLNHLADTKNNLIQETARCPDCGIRTRQRVHPLQ
jgi:DNA-directed RNA polymerase subunit RPC12/RpoP